MKKGDNSKYLSSNKDRFFFHRCVYLGQRLTATTFGELVYSVYHEGYAGVSSFRKSTAMQKWLVGLECDVLIVDQNIKSNNT